MPPLNNKSLPRTALEPVREALANYFKALRKPFYTPPTLALQSGWKNLLDEIRPANPGTEGRLRAVGKNILQRGAGRGEESNSRQ